MKNQADVWNFVIIKPPISLAQNELKYMTTLRLNLKKQWFDMITTGVEKKNRIQGIEAILFR